MSEKILILKSFFLRIIGGDHKSSIWFENSDLILLEELLEYPKRFFPLIDQERKQD